MKEDNKIDYNQEISIFSINDNDPSFQPDKKYSNNRNDSFLIAHQSSSNKILPIKHIQMKQIKSMNFSKRKNIFKNFNEEVSNSSSRKILETVKKESRDNENCVIFNKKDDDNKSECKSEHTFVVLDNKMISGNSELNISKITKMKEVKKTIPEQNWFKNITYVITILNTIQLILHTYPDKFFVICNIFEYIFTICFIIETSIKIAFLGFIKNADSYLRKTPFNILDFLITIGCLLNIIINIIFNIKKSVGFPKIFDIKSNYLNFSEFRLFFLLFFPLDHSKIFSNVNFYLLNIKNIFENLSDISIFVIFLYLFFSLLGLSFWRGRFSYFCHTQNEPIDKNTFPIVDLFQNNFCGGSNKCNSRIDLCLSSKEFYIKGLLEKNVYKKEIDRNSFNYGITKFNNIFQSLLSIFVSSTGDGWDKIMGMAMDAHSHLVSSIFFLILESAFMLLIKNLTLIIILLTFENERELIKKNKVKNKITGEYSDQLLKNVNSRKYIKKYPPIKKPDQNFITKINNAVKVITHSRECHFFIINRSKTNYQKKFYIGYIAGIIYQQYITKIIFNTAIIFNIIIIFIEYIPGNDYITKELSKEKLKIFVLIKLIIVIIYCADQLLVFLSVDLIELFTSFFLCTDFFFSVLCISVFLYQYNNNDSSISLNPSIVYGILRIFKFYNLNSLKKRYFMMTINCIMLVVRRTIYIMPTFFIFLISFSLFGYSLFHGSITFNESGNYDENSKPNEINFKDFTNSLYSSFLILLQYDWTSLFYLTYRSEKNFKPLVLFFYVLMVIFGQFVLMNMILSFLFEKYHYNREKFEDNFDTKNKMISMQLELTKYYQIDKLIHKKKRNYETIISNLVKMNKRLVGQKNEIILVGNSKIDFYKKSAKFDENFYFLHSNKLNIYRKEILTKDVLENYLNESKINSKKLKKFEFWYFNLNYAQEYNEKKNDFERRKSVELNNININHLLNMKRKRIKSNMKLKIKDSIDENLISSITTIEKKNTINNKSSKIQTVLTHKYKNDGNILGKTIIEEIDSKSLDYNMKDLRKRIIKKLINDRKLRRINSKKKFNNFLDKKEEEVKDSNFKKIWKKLKNRSLFLFHWKNKFRIFITNLTSLREFNYIITFLIFAHTIVLWLDTPWVEKNSSQKKILDKFDFYFNIAFIIEGILKIIRYGFIIKEDSRINIKSNINNLQYFLKYLDESDIQKFEEKTKNEQIKIVQNFMLDKNNQVYLSNPYNIIDFICIINSIIDMFDLIPEEGLLQTLLRSIRSIKPLRFINSSSELRFIMKVFVSSLLDVLSVFFMVIIYMIIIAIFGQTLFKDKANYKCSLGFLYLNELECIQNGGYWVFNTYNFSNFLNCFKISFEIIMGENLGKIMEETFLLTRHSLTYPFFVLATILGNIFALKLLLAVVIQSFRKIQKRDDPYINLIDSEKIWLEIQNQMSQYNPNMTIQFEIKKDSLTEKFVKIISNKKFKKIYLILVIFDIILYMSKYEGASYTYLNIINYITFTVSILINIIVILNFMMYNYSSLNIKWHIFELIITVIGDIALILEIIKNHLDDKNRNILKYSQILIEILNSARIIRLLSLNSYFKEIATFFINILIRLTPIMTLLLIVLSIYANLGTIIFGLLPYRTYINSNNNFNNFYNSLIMLFQLLTGSEWNMIMNEMTFHDCRNHSSIEYQSDYYCVHYNVTCFFQDGINYTFLYHFNEHRDKYNQSYVLNFESRNDINAYHLYCGSSGGYIYVISFIIICSILIMSLLVVFILDSYEKSYQLRENIKNSKFMNHILRIWHKYDANCRHLINPPEFVLFFKEIPPPFGLNYDRLISSNPLKYFKKRKELTLFKNKLNNKKKNNEEDIIQFKDSEFNKKGNELPNYYKFNNLYIDHNVKFFTDDIEMLKILNYFDLIALMDKTGVFANQTNTYIFKNENLVDIVFKNNYIHFIDTCMAISKSMASKIEDVDIKSLRENLVNYYSSIKWINNFNSDEAMDLFNSREIPDTYRIINKLSNQILVRSENYYKIIQKKYLKNGYFNLNMQDNISQKSKSKSKKNLDQKSEIPKIIKVFTRTTLRGSFILLPNLIINRTKSKKKDRKNSDADVFNIIKKEFGKK